MRIKVDNLTDLLILIALYKGSKHGYALMKEVGDMLGKKPGHGTVYGFLKELHKKGYLKVSRKGARGMKAYTLTRKGRHMVEDLMDRMESLLSVALERRVHACANCGCEIYSGGILYKINKRKLLFCCEHCAANYLKGKGIKAKARLAADARSEESSGIFIT